MLASIGGLALAAFVMTALTRGQAGVRELRDRSLRWRVGAQRYLVALFGFPLA